MAGVSDQSDTVGGVEDNDNGSNNNGTSLQQSSSSLNGFRNEDDVEEGREVGRGRVQNEESSSSFRRYQVPLHPQEEGEAEETNNLAASTNQTHGQQQQQQEQPSLMDMLDESDYFTTTDNEMMVIISGAIVEDMQHDDDDDGNDNPALVAAISDATPAAISEVVEPCALTAQRTTSGDGAGTFAGTGGSTYSTTTPTSQDGVGVCVGGVGTTTSATDRVPRPTATSRLSFHEVSMAFSLANGPDAILVEASRDTFWSKLNDKRIRSIIILLVVVGLGLIIGILFAVTDIFSNESRSKVISATTTSPPSSAPSSIMIATSPPPLPTTTNPSLYKLPFDKIKLTYHDTCGTVGQWRQSNYRGNISQTVSGITCQYWSKQIPQTHRFVPIFFEKEYGVGNHNYCRNPDPYDIYDPYRKAFCIPNITTLGSIVENNDNGTSRTSYEYCNVPACGFCGKRTVGADTDTSSPYGYDTSCSQTCATDLDCNGSEDVEDSSSLQQETCLFDTDCHMWTTTPRHHHLEDEDDTNINSNENTNSNIQELNNDLYLIYTTPISMYCGSKAIGQANYRGSINITNKGYTCQEWNSQFPHTHIEHSNHNPYNGLDKNYCRNPTGKDRAWCYTTNPEIEWQYCAVPYCE